MNEAATAHRPMVSVILAVRNEVAFIRETVGSLLEQETSDFDLEILVVDGQSSDGSPEIVRELARNDPRVRFFCNERVRTPSAFNIGLREARGQYVCILGAHSTYPKDYVAICLRELIARAATGCSGYVISRPRNDGLPARLVNWTVAHPFGSSGRSFRTQGEGYVDTIAYPVMNKSVLLGLGGYDEALHRNQDNDMNERLCAAGHKLYCTGKTHAAYYTQGSVAALLGYAFRNGYWNVITLRRSPASMRLRHLVPGAFVFALLLAAITALAGAFLAEPFRLWSMIPLGLLLGAHLLAGLLAAVQVAVRHGHPAALCLPVVFFSFHAAYGIGSAWALVSGARCQPVAGLLPPDTSSPARK